MMDLFGGCFGTDFYLWTLSLLVGVASGDMTCATTNSSLCLIRLVPTFLDPSAPVRPDAENICLFVHQIRKCYEDAGLYCDMEHDYILNNITFTLRDVCTERSELEYEYIEYRDCLSDVLTAKRSQECTKDFIQDYGKLQQPTNEAEGMKYWNDVIHLAVCKYGDGIVDCLHRAIDDKCGEHADEFCRRLDAPFLDMAHRFCGERGGAVGLEAPLLLLPLLLMTMMMLAKRFED